NNPSNFQLGVAYGISQLENFNVDYYINFPFLNVPITYFVPVLEPQVINQSFTYTPDVSFTSAVINQSWDSFVATQGYVIASGAGNGGDVQNPATSYNVIAVGGYGGASSISKLGQLARPDVVVAMPVLDGYTSFSSPVVSG